MKIRINTKWLLAVLLITPILINALPTKVSGEMWMRWINESGKYADADGDLVNKFSKNYLSLERGYFGLETTFTPNTKSRFTVDMFSNEKLEDGGGLKLKYAYVDFASLIPVPEMILSAGLQKVYFGTIYDWNYTLIGKAPTDEYKVANSADFGLTINGFLPNGFGEYAFGIYNGEGYKKVGSALGENTDFAYLGNVRFTPVSGITLGGSYMSNTVKRDKTLADDSPVTAYEEQTLIDAVVRLNYSLVDLWGEYISKDMKFPNQTGKDYKATGIMVMPIVNLLPVLDHDIQLIGRYDIWDETDKPSTASKYLLNATTLGVNYNFFHDERNVPAMQLQLNYTMKNHNEDESGTDFADGKKDTNNLWLQLKWRFSSAISN